jgi:hypothetical protein
MVQSANSKRFPFESETLINRELHPVQRSRCGPSPDACSRFTYKDDDNPYSLDFAFVINAVH